MNKSIDKQININLTSVTVAYLHSSAEGKAALWVDTSDIGYFIGNYDEVFSSASKAFIWYKENIAPDATIEIKDI